MTADAPTHGPTPASLSRIAARLFAHEPLVPRLMQRYRPFISPFHTLLPIVPEGATTLDVGCGRGLFLTLLAHAGRIGPSVGFDIAADAVAAAERARAGLPPREAAKLRFSHCPVGSPWPAGLFDVVSMVDVLHHVPPSAQEQVVREALARVRPGGLFLYKDMCERPHWRAALNRLHDLVVAQEWIVYRSVRDVERWAADAGFGLAVQHNEQMWWYGHELRVFRRG